MRDATAIVGIGETRFFKRGQSLPQTRYERAGLAIKESVADAGLSLDDVDGLTLYANGGGIDPAVLAEMLGIPHLRLAVVIPGTGGGSAGAVGVAAAAICAGMASVVVTVMALQILQRRPTAAFAEPPN